MSAVTLYVPGDASAVSVGADRVAQALEVEAGKRGRQVRIVRNGSRGLFWLEPLVEVVTAAGRVAYGPVSAAQVPKLLDAGLLEGGAQELRLGDMAVHPWLASQQRLTAARLGIVDPASLDDYLAHGGYAGLDAALSMQPADIVRTITESGLRGRGGAAFPTGIKWQTVLDQRVAQKYIACNADEGDSGTFSDRMLMEGDPFSLIEGMTIAGLAVGATQGYIYLRVEYPHAARALARALKVARERGFLGEDVRGSGKRFDIAVRLGAGAYICGEETSMLESLEGRRGEVRVRPPLPAIKGLFGQPTVVNNVVTLATVPIVLARGAQFYKDFGVGKSRGTIPLQLAGNVKQGGLVERAFGLTVDELVNGYGGGSASGRPVRAVQIGGPLGAYLPTSQFDTPLEYEALVGQERAAGSRRRRGFRRSRRHGAHGALCAGVLRGGVLRQVHTLPARVGARRRARGPHHCRSYQRRAQRRATRGSRTARRALRHHVQRIAVRAGRHDAVPGAQRAHTFSRGFPARSLSARGREPCTPRIITI